MHVTQIDSARLETQSGSDAASLLSQIGAHATTRFSSSLAMLELAPAHASMIQVLAAQPGMSQSALAKTPSLSLSRQAARGAAHMGLPPCGENRRLFRRVMISSAP